MNNLGLALAARAGTLHGESALAWFRRAAEGGHQGGMYNYGHTLASQGGDSDALKVALQWFHAAAQADPNTTVGKNALAAVAHVEAALSNSDAGERSGDAASTSADDRARLLPLSAQGLALWDTAAASYKNFEARFQALQVVDDDSFADLRAAAASLEALGVHLQQPAAPLGARAEGGSGGADQGEANLWTPERADVVLGAQQEVYAALARGDQPSELAAAARVNAARAQLPSCQARYAVHEGEASCWNTAVSSAATYFRRAGDVASAESVVAQLARQHPRAATQYPSSLQTPHVLAPGLTAQPWWNASSFSLTRILEQSYKEGKLQDDIAKLLALSASATSSKGAISGAAIGGSHGSNYSRSSSSSSSSSSRSSSSSSSRSSGSRSRIGETSAAQLARVFSPAAPIASRTVASDREGSGVWAELVLFDGVAWHSDHCAVVPALCQLLQASGALCGQQQQPQPQQPQASTKIATITTGPSSPIEGAAGSPSLDECGTRVVATVFKLSPGARVQPHTGTTNRRLVLQFALAGSAGVRFRVGNEWRTYAEGSSVPSSTSARAKSNTNTNGDGDGSGLVFDDSFEHEVFHNGSNDRYVLYAAMHHPDRLHEVGAGLFNGDDNMGPRKSPPKTEEAQNCEADSGTNTAAEVHTEATGKSTLPPESSDRRGSAVGSMKARRWAPRQWWAALRQKIRHSQEDTERNSANWEVALDYTGSV